MSIDSDTIVTESFWGEADYAFSDLVRVRAGFTMSMASALGYSVTSGVDLSDVVEYLAEPQSHSGISNTLVLDWRF